MDGCHPRIELLVEATGQEADVGASDGDERAVDGETLVAALLDDLLEPGGDCEDGLAGSRTSIERDDGDVGIEQQFEGEALFLAARSQPPGLGRVLREQHELVVHRTHER